VTAAKVQAHFAPWLPGQVDVWPLPNILAIKLVLHGALQGGGARNLRLDNLGKAMGAALLRMEIDVSPEALEQAGSGRARAQGLLAIQQRAGFTAQPEKWW
jgi:hypothetical protein